MDGVQAQIALTDARMQQIDSLLAHISTCNAHLAQLNAHLGACRAWARAADPDLARDLKTQRKHSKRAQLQTFVPLSTADWFHGRGRGHPPHGEERRGRHTPPPSMRPGGSYFRGTFEWQFAEVDAAVAANNRGGSVSWPAEMESLPAGLREAWRSASSVDSGEDRDCSAGGEGTDGGQSSEFSP